MNKQNKDKGESFLVKSYLLFYNGFQTIGWSYLLYLLVTYYTRDYDKYENLWSYVSLVVIIFQNAAVVEIINAACGFVKSNPVLTTFQVFSRVMVVCGVILATPDAKVSPGLPLALLAWSITEIIRYGYYALNIIKMVPNILIWLRYTTFIILYPIGVTGELLCFYWAQSYAQKYSVWSVYMPNKFNVTFSYLHLLWFVMLSYIPIFPQLYLHMFSQRKKMLNKPSSQIKAKKAI